MNVAVTGKSKYIGYIIDSFSYSVWSHVPGVEFLAAREDSEASSG